MIVPARRRHPRSVNYRSAGFGVFNPPSRPTYEQCDPFDQACVARNAAKSDAYDLAIAGAQAQNNFDVCMQGAANTNSPAQYADAVARCNGAFSGAVVNAEQTAATPVTWTNPTAPPAPVPVFAAPPAPVAPPSVTTITPAGSTTQSGAVVVKSSGVETTPFPVAATGGFSLSAIPWWGWAAAAGVALFAFGGGHGR